MVTLWHSFKIAAEKSPAAFERKSTLIGGSNEF